MDFIPFPKLPRLNKPMIVTEKIDGTNACVVIEDETDVLGRAMDFNELLTPETRLLAVQHTGAIREIHHDDRTYFVGAQSRKRMVLPEHVKPGGDNAGFADWVERHAADLVAALGPGRHFGEWWGPGIQRGYGIPARRFSLFNVDRYADVGMAFADGTVLTTVPVLHRGPFDTSWVTQCVLDLRESGSKAAPGWDRPEGVVVYHTASGQSFKAFCDPADEAAPKGARR